MTGIEAGKAYVKFLLDDSELKKTLKTVGTLEMTPFSIFQLRSAGLVDGGAFGAAAPARPPPAGTVQPVKSFPFESSFQAP